MKKHDDTPLLSVSDDFGFATIADVVQNGEHLEHFRSYQKVAQPSSLTSSSASLSSAMNETIELHVDQGLFLVFTPGRMYSTRKTDSPTISSGFFIKDQQDAIVEVSFEEEDDLVFMIGDGFDQYVNDRLTKTLRPVPHSLIMSPQEEGEMETRAWYGRMVLPPFDAVHPSHGLTFGELREQMIRSTNNKTEETFHLGCSGEMMARDLGSVKCEGDSIYCWHRCMAPAEYDITAEECLSQDLQLLCVDANFQISDGNSHGDYFLGCADPTGGQQQQQQATSLDNSDFCRGNLGTVMYMDSFHWSFKGGFPCINLFFASWTLDTKVKFLLGMLGVICFAMSVEGVSRLRRVVAHRAQKSAPEERSRYSLYQTSLHGLHALSGYLLMLVTMTYSWELLLSVIVGLMIGFFLFSDATRTTSSPCCAFLEPTLESPTSAGAGGANPANYGAVETSEPRTEVAARINGRSCCKGESVSEGPNIESSVVHADVA